MRKSLECIGMGKPGSTDNTQKKGVQETDGGNPWNYLPVHLKHIHVPGNGEVVRFTAGMMD
jgi:hypothetical protein